MPSGSEPGTKGGRLRLNCISYQLGGTWNVQAQPPQLHRRPGPAAALRGPRPSRSRARGIRRGMFLGCGGRLPGDPRSAADRRRLHRRPRPQSDLRAGLQPPHRPRRGRGGVVRPGAGQLRPAARDVLADSQSDHPQPPGPGLRQPVPVGDLLPRSGSGGARDRVTRHRAAITATADRHGNHSGVSLLPGRGIPPALSGEARPGELRRHHRQSGPQAEGRSANSPQRRT